MKFIYEKRHRLKKECYIGNISVFYTACIKDKKELFISDKIFEAFEKYLVEEFKRNKCELFIYVLMPDHLHLIAIGKENNSNVKKAMKIFKQKTGFWLAKNISEFKWQKDYYDYIIRSDESLVKITRYILLNPVRKGLVNDWYDYKYKGSSVFNLDEWK